jgi:hypothetical protein
MIIQFYADSLGLPRHKLVNVSETYIQIAMSWLRNNHPQEVYCYDRAKGGSLISDLFTVYNEDLNYIPDKKDILIIHEGICDCAPRPIHPKLRKVISVLPSIIKNVVIKFIHNNRAKLLKIGSKYTNTNPQKYRQIFTEWMQSAILNFDKIIVFTIAPTDSKTEMQSPGFSKLILDYNKIISEVIKQINNNKIILLDTFSEINNNPDSINDYISPIDGHHLTKNGHALYSTKLLEALSKNV